MADWTPEPWECNGNGIHKRVSAHFADGVAAFSGEQRHANAARAAACVNGCRGIADPETAVPALVSALERYVGKFGNCGETYARARAALAACEATVPEGE